MPNEPCPGCQNDNAPHFASCQAPSKPRDHDATRGTLAGNMPDERLRAAAKLFYEMQVNTHGNNPYWTIESVAAFAKEREDSAMREVAPLPLKLEDEFVCSGCNRLYFIYWDGKGWVHLLKEQR
jgi:hypothetical protein